MRSSKILTIAVTFAILSSVVMPIFSMGPVANAAASASEVKIGFLNPITGPLAEYAPAFNAAADVAIDDLNAANTGYTFVLAEGDSKCSGTDAATAASQLISDGVVGIAGAACSGATLGAMPAARDAGIPMVSYASTSPAVTPAMDSDFLFRVVPSDEQQGQAMAAMAKAHGWQKPALIFMTNDYGAGLAESFAKNFFPADTNSDGNFTDEACVSIGYNVETTTDFTTQVTTFAAGECDSLVMITYATDGALLLEAMATAGIQGPTSAVCSADCPFPIMGADGIADQSFLGAFSSTDNAAAAAMVIATKPRPGTNTTEKGDFETKFEAGGGDVSSIYIREVYDAVSIIGKAKVAADAAADGTTVRDHVRLLGSGTGYSGASGLHVFDGQGDVVGSGYDVCQFVAATSGLVLNCMGGGWGLLSGLELTFTHKPAVPIGFLNPQTGPIAEYSAGFTIAANVAIGYMNTIQPLNFQFKLEMADSGCSGATAATAATSLIAKGVVGIAGAACSGATLGAMPVAKDAGIPMVSYASTSPALTTAADGGYLFRVVPSDEQQGQALASVVKKAGYTNPAILHMTNDYGAGFADAFETNFGTNCTKIGYNVETQTSFATQITAIKEANCDSLVMITYATDGAKIMEEAVTQGLDLPVYGGDGIADAAFKNAFTDASAIEGITATKPGAAPTTAYGGLFDALFAQAIAANGLPSNYTAIYARETFDAIAAVGLAFAMAQVTPIETDGPKDMLGVVVGSDASPFNGASGVHVFDANGDVVGSGYDVCTFNSTLELDCHSSWGLITGLTDGGIAKKPADTTPTPTDNNTTTPTDNNTTPTEEEVKEAADEVPGFGLLSVFAAVGVVLVLRRRL